MEKPQATDNCVLEGNLQYKITIFKVFVLARAWKYLEWGGNSFAVRYTGHKLSVEDLCTVAPSVLSVNVIFHGELKYESDCKFGILST